MNIPVLIAAVLAFVAFLAHAFIGDKEYRAFKPTESDPEKIKETWVQVRSGWHWVSVDLLLSCIVLLLIATTNIIKSKDAYLSLLFGYFLLCGIVWLGTVVLSRNNNKQILVLGQWIFCFLMSALILWGMKTA